MLSIIVSDAVRGVNIAAKYPVFFLRMLENRALLDEFLDSLALLKKTQAGTLDPLPSPPCRDLRFLTARPRPELTLVKADDGGWGAALRLCAVQLTNLFFTVSPEPATRKGVDIIADEDNWFTLFRETITNEEGSWSVILEGTSVDELEENLLLLAVIVVPMLEPEHKDGSWQATLTWGGYQATVALDKDGHASFPWLRLDSVLDEGQQSVVVDLTLQLSWLSEQPISPTKPFNAV